jgi:hypothetical protein
MVSSPKLGRRVTPLPTTFSCKEVNFVGDFLFGATETLEVGG